jgi:pilus assembly protein Flp/PilA
MHEESGVTAMEYGLLAGLIAVVIIRSIASVGIALQGKFNAVASNMS